MPEELDSREVGGNFMRGVRRKKRRGILGGVLERLGLKNPSEEEKDDDINKYSFPRMRYENTKFGNGTQNIDETSNAGIGDVGTWRSEDTMMAELSKRQKAKMRQMVREANRSRW